MDRKMLWRLGTIGLVLVLAIWFLVPTIRLAAMDADERARLAQEDPEALRDLENRAISLGLDLRGGIHLVVEVDPTGLTEEELEDAHRRALEVIRNRIDEFGVEEPIIQPLGEGRILVQLAGVDDPERAKEIVRRTAYLEFKLVARSDRAIELLQVIDEIAREHERDLELKAAEAESGAAGTDSMDAALPAVASADSQGPAATGADSASTEASTEKSQTDELFADLDLEEIEAEETESAASAHPFLDLIRFNWLDAEQKEFALLVPEENLPKVQEILALPEVQDIIPEDLEFRFGVVEGDERSGGRYANLYLLQSDAELTGEAIERAYLDYDSRIGQPVVSVRMKPDFARRFAEITGENIGRRLAIVLDGKVRSAPYLRTRISNGSAQIEGGFDAVEANDLAVVLRSGALPAPIRVIEERTVGATLGADSVAAGRNAGIFGLVLVLVFMVVYYRLSGLVADAVLVLNTILILAALAAFSATLTLPGIAGIVLTMGMAVDANVLVFERIREEFRTGKSLVASIQTGYDRALRTIIDANVTTFFTAAILFNYGSGPIRGFAVTLMIGIVTSVFTAVFCSRVAFDLLYGKGRLRKLSI